MTDNQTGDLFGWKVPAPPPTYPHAPGHRGVATSVAAAEAIKPVMGAQQRKIMEYLGTRANGATYTEIEADTGLKTQSICARIHELRADGHVVIADETRATPSGRQAHVYKIKGE